MLRSTLLSTLASLKYLFFGQSPPIKQIQKSLWTSLQVLDRLYLSVLQNLHRLQSLPQHVLPFSISLCQNSLAILHHPALKHWFVFPLSILQRRHLFNLLLHLFFLHGAYCIVTIHGRFTCGLCWFYSLVAFLDIQAHLHTFI